MSDQLSLLGIGTTAGISLLTAIFTVVITAMLTRRRKHLADWRKLNFAQYQEFVLALSGIVEGRQTNEANLRFADAANSMRLIASTSVLHAMEKFFRGKIATLILIAIQPNSIACSTNYFTSCALTYIRGRRRNHPKLTLGLTNSSSWIEPTSK